MNYCRRSATRALACVAATACSCWPAAQVPHTSQTQSSSPKAGKHGAFWNRGLPPMKLSVVANREPRVDRSRSDPGPKAQLQQRKEVEQRLSSGSQPTTCDSCAAAYQIPKCGLGQVCVDSYLWLTNKCVSLTLGPCIKRTSSRHHRKRDAMAMYT